MRYLFLTLFQLSRVLFAGEFHLQLEAGKTIELTLPDGRVAHMVLDRRAPLALPLPFQVTDNTCVDVVGEYCAFRAGLGNDFLALVWKTHPDPKKIGSTVSFTSKADSSKTFCLAQQLYGAQEKVSAPIMAGGISHEVLECKDYRWLPSGEVAAPESITFSRFDVELMFENPETGLKENRTVGVALGLPLKKNADGFLEVFPAKKYLSNSFTAFFGDIWAVILKRPTGGFCQISMKPNVVGLDKKLINYLSEKPNFVPYLYMSDEWSKQLAPRFLQMLPTLDAEHYDYE